MPRRRDHRDERRCTPGRTPVGLRRLAAGPSSGFRQAVNRSDLHIAQMFMTPKRLQRSQKWARGSQSGLTLVGAAGANIAALL
jgi:hypothetical protein